MKIEKIIIKSIEGIDARYAADMAAIVRKYDIEFALIQYKGLEYNLKSVLSIVSAQIPYGGEIELVVEGIQKSELLTEIKFFLEELKNA